MRTWLRRPFSFFARISSEISLNCAVNGSSSGVWSASRGGRLCGSDASRPAQRTALAHLKNYSIVIGDQTMTGRLTRHALLKALLLLLLSSNVIEAGPQQRYELVLKGGHVIDPQNGIDGPKDVAI